MSDLWTDQDVLSTEAYATDANLAGRQSMYAYCGAPEGFHAWVRHDVQDPDPHGFDRDEDGVGCES